MHYDLSILRALVRLARRCDFGSLDALTVRTGGTFEEARAAVARLESIGLAERTARGIRPTLAGLAVSVATVARARASRPVTLVARPKAARRRAA